MLTSGVSYHLYFSACRLVCYGRMIFGPVPFFDIHHILQNRSISCWHFQELQEKSTVAQTCPNPTWNIFGPQINTPNSSIPNLQCFYPILSKPRSAGEGAADGTTHKVHQTARRLGLSRDHVTSHLNTSQPLAPWNSLPTKNFGKFQKHLSSIMQPIPVHPFLFPAVFGCCEHPFLSVPLENTLDNRPPDTTVVLGVIAVSGLCKFKQSRTAATTVYRRLPLSTSESFPP